MQIRRFYANTLSGAMRDIRRALGPDAFIMSSRQLPAGHKVYMQDGSRPRFEVTAAVESAGAGGERPVHDFQPVTRPPAKPLERRADRRSSDTDSREPDSDRQPSRDLSDGASRAAGLLRKPRPPVQPEMKDMLAARSGSVLKRSFRREGEPRDVAPVQEKGAEPEEASAPPRRRPLEVLRRAADNTRAAAQSEEAAEDGETAEKRSGAVSSNDAREESLPEAPRSSLLDGVGSVAELREIIRELKQLREQLREEKNGSPVAANPASTAPGAPRPNPYVERAARSREPANPDAVQPRPSPVFGSDESDAEDRQSAILPACDLQKALRAQGVDEPLLQRILERMQFDVEADEDGRGALRRLVRVVSDFIPETEPITYSENGPRLVVMTGPTGVGKTTTVAKIASHHALLENQRVGLVTLDTCRVGAAEQLKTYARLLGVPVKVQSDPGRLHRTIEEFSDMDLVLVDTPGLSPVDVASFERLCQAIRPLRGRAEIHLEMTASTRGSEMRRIMETYRPLGYNRLIFSKMDESGCWGELLNTWIMGGTSVSYFTTGQRVPEDFEDASLEALCEALVTEI